MSDQLIERDRAARERAKERGRQKRSQRRRARALRRPDIQGLRAVAVVAVILNHLAGWPDGAFVGVDVFFVVSGFLITGVLLREYESTDKISFRGFYRRRIKRIVPAATLVLLTTCSASYVLLSHARFVAVVKDAVAAFFFASNWRFQAAGTDYFQQGLPPSPLQHYWSLSIEEQFYFVWPWLLLGLMLLGVRRLGWSHPHLRVVAGTTISVVVVASFAWAMSQTASQPSSAYFSTLTRVWELGIGALVAVAAPRLVLRNAHLRTVLAWVGLIGIVVSLFLVPAGDGFPAPWAALPVLATALVIVAGIGGSSQLHLWPLVSRQASYVGDLSYSLYLWHFPVIVLLAAVIESDTAIYYALAVLLIAGLSVASYHGLENPARHGVWIYRGRHRFRFTPGLKYTLLGAVAIVTAALVTASLTPGRFATPSAPAAAFEGGRAVSQQQAEAIRCVGAAAMVPSHDCPLNSGPGLTPSVDNLGDDTEGAFKCWLTADDPYKVCHYGSEKPDATRIALVGDSHAVLLIPALAGWLDDENWSVDSFAGENCQWQGPVPGSPVCKAMPQIQEQLKTGGYDAVIVTAARDRYETDAPADDMIAANREVWEPVSATGTQIIVVSDNPLPSEESLLCVQRVGFSPDSDDCGTAEDDAYEKQDFPVLTADQIPGAEVIDTSGYFCRDGECPSVIGNVIVYRDAVGHITEPYAQTLGQFLVPQIRRILHR